VELRAEDHLERLHGRRDDLKDQIRGILRDDQQLTRKAADHGRDLHMWWEQSLD